MPKGKKAKGKKEAPALAMVKKQEAKKVVNPCSRRGPIILALDRTSNPRGTSPALSNGPATSGCSSKGLFSISC